MSKPLSAERESTAPGEADLASRLRDRRVGIEETLLARVGAVTPEPPVVYSSEYEVGLMAAVAALTEFALSGIEHGDKWDAPVPPAAIEQARRAARENVGLDIVLRRYAGGHGVLNDAVMAEAERVPAAILQRVLTRQNALLGHLIDVISREYKAEEARIRHSNRELRALAIERLLASEPVEAHEIGYELNAWHLAVIISGSEPQRWLEAIRARFSGDVLPVQRSDTLIWAWLGAPKHHTPRRLAARLDGLDRSRCVIALGETMPGHAGFRRSFEQAQAAHRVSLHVPKKITLFADDMLLSTAIIQQNLRSALEAVYLGPIRELADGGKLLDTLRAYIDAQRNVSKAARRQGVDRHTVERHLGAISQRIGRPIASCIAELEVALRLDEVLKREPARLPEA